MDKYRKQETKGSGLDGYSILEQQRAALASFRKWKRDVQSMNDPGESTDQGRTSADAIADAVHAVDEIIGQPLLERIQRHRQAVKDHQGVLDVLAETREE